MPALALALALPQNKKLAHLPAKDLKACVSSGPKGHFHFHRVRRGKRDFSKGPAHLA